jgi:tRNA pseudouridine55 synthase
MYSALKVKGKKLYQLARQGKEIERKPRSVTIYRLDVLAWQPPDLTLEVVCSAGTYIRSLAHDLGQVVGCGGHLRALTRTRTGAFHLEESYRLEELQALAAEGRLEEALLPPKAALYMMPFVHLSSAQVQAVRHGQSIILPPVFCEAEAAAGRDEVATSASQVQARDEDDRLVAILIPTVGEAPPNGEKWRPKLVLPPPETSG